MTTILIWEIIPERTEIYIFHEGDLKPDELVKMKDCHQTFLNVQESDELNWLNEFLDTPFSKGRLHEGIGPVKTADNVCLIVSGFAL